MSWYHYFFLLSSGIFLVSMGFHLVNLIKAGNPVDYARSSGKTSQAIRYSFTKAMNPGKKESAFLHLPTYTAGIIYHLGTFLSIFLFFLSWFYLPGAGPISIFLSGFLIISICCGVGILIKRMSKKTLKGISNADDYISNVLISLFQLGTAVWLLNTSVIPWYFLITSLVLLYFPIGKLKHALYFFAARYQLGLFYGRRGVWPPKSI